MNASMKISIFCDINRETISRKETDVKIEYLDTSSITENKIQGTHSFLLSEAPSRAQRKVKRNTIIYSLVRPNLKHYGILDNPTDAFIVSTGFATIDIKGEYMDKVDPYYLYYALTTPCKTAYLHTIAENSVSAYPSINPSDLGEIEIELPDITIQRCIAAVLKSFDSKIKLNEQINQNLAA